MKFLPYEEITYYSQLKSGDVLYRISDNLEPERTFRFKGLFFTGSSKPYEGWVDDNGTFKLKRIIGYKNSFLPVIEGSVKPEYFGSKIKLKLRLDKFVMVFVIVWMTAVGIASIATIIGFLNDPSIDRMAFIPIGMFVFGYALTMLAFKFESAKSKRDLVELLQLEIEEH